MASASGALAPEERKRLFDAFVGDFEATLHSFYTVLRFTCPCTNRCSSMCVDASVTGARTGWVNALDALLRSPEALRVRIPASQPQLFGIASHGPTS